MAKKKKGKQTKGGSSLRKTMQGKGAFFLRRGKEKPKSPPGEVKPDPKKPEKE